MDLRDYQERFLGELDRHRRAASTSRTGQGLGCAKTLYRGLQRTATSRDSLRLAVLSIFPNSRPEAIRMAPQPVLSV